MPETLIHDLPLVTIRRVSVTAMDNNVYLITAKDTGAQVLIDAAGGINKIRRMLADAERDASEPTRLALVVTTHRHWDHIRALRELTDEYAVRTAAGTEDAAAIEAQTGVRADVLLDDGDVGEFDGFDLTAIGLRGHTPGSIALAYVPPTGPAHIFSGDSLFPGGVGNTDRDPARFESLIDDVSTRLFDRYADDTVVHPGHGKPTTLGEERRQLAEWRARGW